MATNGLGISSREPGEYIIAANFSQRHLLFQCLSCGGGFLKEELVGDRPISHVPFYWDSLVDLLQHFNYSGVLPRCGIASRLSSLTTMGKSLYRQTERQTD